MKNIVVIAPHPDDETLGCGGTLLNHKQKGDNIHWIIVTKMTSKLNISSENILKRQKEISEVTYKYGFSSVHELKFPTTLLDTIPIGDIIAKISDVFLNIRPNIVYVPYRGDVHTDHAIVFDAAIACTKWFRYPFVERVLMYETLSETDFNLNLDLNGFRPNVFVNIEPYLQQKIDIMNIFDTEIEEFPFPRSVKAIKSLAHLRGAAAGYEAAEAFMLLKERV
ncbi:PIG-L deacetylase family protein [Virgibacillus doumboii]|uniref:PIG-L deacetylase family protein n=1 Tax=Virgibacillus doumboii TaxID=2697503 RepID=UPI0013E013CF|nr:PIG-L family deacetylase [Virgibacillus doumboii]